MSTTEILQKVVKSLTETPGRWKFEQGMSATWVHENGLFIVHKGSHLYNTPSAISFRATPESEWFSITPTNWLDRLALWNAIRLCQTWNDNQAFCLKKLRDLDTSEKGRAAAERINLENI